MDEQESSWTSLINLLFYLPYPDDCRQRFVERLKVYYNEDDAKIKVLEEFENDYNGENAINWYTRETFLYSILNRALRQHNVLLMFLFGFFLQDLYRQLQREHKQFKSKSAKTKLTLYRGQFISASELRHQRCPLAPLPPKIINNSLFSTTSNRSRALLSVNPALDPDDVDSDQSVLFEIEVNIREQDDDSPYRRPFADITHLSHFNSEEETLFMIGTSFRFNRESIQFNTEEHVWIFKLELDNYSYEIYETELEEGSSCKRRALQRCITQLVKGNRKRVTSTSFPMLEAIFRELFEMYPAETTWLTAMKNHCHAVYLQFVEENYKEALPHYYKSLNLWSSYVADEELNCFNDMGEIQHQIAEILHFEIENLKKARVHYGQSIKFFELAISGKFTFSNYERIQVYNELALVYERKCKFNDCKRKEDYLTTNKYRELYFLNIFKCYSPINTIRTWSILDIIAGTYSYVGEIDKAISYYETALALREGLIALDDYAKNLCPSDSILPLIYIYRSLIKLYMNHKRNFKIALNYRLILYEYELQYEREHAKNGPEKEKKLLAEQHSDLADIYRGLDQYCLAYEHLQAALKQYREVEQADSVKWDIIAVEEKVVSLTLQLS
jgi:hypothetical protein